MDRPLPSTMKSPKDSRPDIWPMHVVPGSNFGGVMQVHLTRNCDLACSNCTQGSQLSGKISYMTPEQFEQAMISLTQPTQYPGVVGIFGGNPTLSKHFEEICEILRKYIPYEFRGLWSNALHGHGKTCRRTFNPDVSNLNVHLNSAAYEEIRRDWPMAQPKGLNEDSLHSPPLVAMQDMEDLNEEGIWDRIAGCDVNQRWSAIICVFRGELRGFFCELAGAQAMLHDSEPDYPDLGKTVEPGWWNRPMEHFDAQVRYHCFACGHPLRGKGDFAVTGTREQVSKTHMNIYKLKRPKGKTIELITRTDQLGAPKSAATQYLSTERE